MASDSFSYSTSTPQLPNNNWQYGEEASLYSIAEDSREDRASEVPSMAGTQTSSILHGVNILKYDNDNDEEQQQQQQIEVSRNSEDSQYGYQPYNARRRNVILAGCVLGVLLVSIASVVILAVTKPGGQDRGSVGPGSSVGEGETTPNVPMPPEPIPAPVSPPVTPPLPEKAPPTSTPTTSPTRIPTASPTHSLAYTLAQGLVTTALQECPHYALHSDLVDNLVHELYNQTVEINGFLQYPLSYGFGFLQERYGLSVLYENTNGNDWINASGGWNTPTDPCNWYGITHCTTRHEGSCAITHINLRNNNLVGPLPAALCCLPCLETIQLFNGNNNNNNNIVGKIPECLQDKLVVMMPNNATTMELAAASQRSSTP